MGLRYKPSAEYRQLVERLLDTGDWEGVDTTDSQNHARLRYIPTGETITYSIHAKSSDRHGVRNTAKEAERISGFNPWDRGSRRRSRKAIRGTDFSTGRARREGAAWHQQNDAAIKAALDVREDAITRLSSMTPSDVRRRRAVALRLLEQIHTSEAELTRLSQPFEPFQGLA